jgi:hypothetical protein
MATTIVTKNSSTASAVPTTGQLVQGELAVNVADKKLFTEDNAGSIIVLADGVKLAGIEALADVTDTANVTAAGALMDSEVTNLAQVKAFDSADYATAAQGTTADAALPTTGGAMTGAITTNSTFDGRDVSVDGAKLDGIEVNATADQTALEIKTAYESNADTNAFTDADETKLDGIEASATADQTAAEIKTAYESNADTNAFTDADHTKLDGIEASATADQTDAEIRAAVEAATDSNVFTDADHSKLNAIEASADVTDTANVTAAGALMDSELTNITAVKALDQGVATTDSPQFVSITSTSNVIVGGDLTVNGTTTTLNTATLDVEDKNITINYGAGDTTGSANGAGITIQDAVDASTDATILWDTTNDEFDFSHPINVAGTSVFASLDITGEITANGGIALGDNDYATFGAGDDLQIFHDGNHSWIKDAGTGNIYISSDGYAVNIVKGDNTASVASFIPDGPVNLYNAGDLKLATTATGIDVTGTVTMDGLTVANTAVVAGDFDGGTAATYIRLQDDTDNFLFGSNNSLGNFLIKNETADAFRLSVANTGDISFYEDTGTTPKFFWDASAESLGIGTSSPSAALDITGIIKSASATQSSLYLSNAARTNGFLIGRSLSSNDAQDLFIYDTVAAATRLSIDSSGNVGIGTSSPSSALHVSASPEVVTRLTRSAGSNALVLFQDPTSTTAPYIGSYGNAMAFGRYGGGESMRIDSSGNVGIGTSSPSSYPIAPNLVVDAGTNGGITIKTGSSNYGGVFFADGTTGNEQYRGFIQYNHNYVGSTDSLLLGTGGSERMRIDSSGNVMVGKSSSSFTSAGVEILPDGRIVAGRAGETLVLNRLTTDGDIALFRKDGSTVGSIGTRADLLKIGTGDVGLLFNSTSDAILPENIDGGAGRDTAIDLGVAGARFKDLYLSGGVYLGGTGAANHLDDYEEGTWTPTWTPASGSGQTISTASGWYTKTGNRVFVDIHLATNGHGTASGDLTLGGLPFTQTTNSGQNASLSCGQAANAGLVAGQAGAARVNQSATTITPLVWSATTGTTTMTAAQWGVSGTWRFTGSYQV